MKLEWKPVTFLGDGAPNAVPTEQADIVFADPNGKNTVTAHVQVSLYLDWWSACFWIDQDWAYYGPSQENIDDAKAVAVRDLKKYVENLHNVVKEIEP